LALHPVLQMALLLRLSLAAGLPRLTDYWITLFAFSITRGSYILSRVWVP
jgi:hypothetical protein